MNKEPKHICKNCLYRHGCKYKLKDYSQECPHFKIGKCFICALRNEENICEAEDQSGYGRLGDLDALETEMVNGIHAGNYAKGYKTFAHINNMEDCVECVKFADTIIEATKKNDIKEI